MATVDGGRLRARFARGAGDVARAQALRFRRFRAGAGGPGSDRDAFDDGASHLLVEEAATGRLAACCRLRAFADGAGLGASYAAQFYGLARLARHPGPLIEIGRFCVAEGPADPAVLRVAWGALAAAATARGAEVLFGCTSFAGTDPAVYRDAFALLRARHLGPARWRPSARAPTAVRFPSDPPADPLAAARAIPPLLRAYLAMGGWVGDHAVVDRDLGTLHVFTALEVRVVPEARRRALRAHGDAPRREPECA
jgi:putative hemolysin